MKRLQNIASESRLTLPLLAVYAALAWLAGGLAAGGLWVQFACFAASTYLMVELNNANALIRVYSRMVSGAFLVLSCAAPFLFASTGGNAAELFAIASLAALFRSYQDKEAAGKVFAAFLCLGTGSLFCAHLLYYVPVVWLLMAAFLRSMSIRTLSASVLGTALPYWFATVIMGYMDKLGALAGHLAQLADTSHAGDFSHLSATEWAATALITAAAVTGIVHYRRQCLGDKIRTRMLYDCFITTFIASAALLAALPRHYDLALRMMTISASPLIAHFMALTNTKVTNIAFHAFVAAAVAVTAFNLWMH